MPCRRLVAALRSSIAICSLLCLATVLAEPCQENPRDYSIVQFTAETCKCCYDLDEFIQDNDYVYVLFYSPKGRLNIDISAKFEQLAAEWKWSRIAFGRIDVDKDRDMAKKWVEQGMVPTNVMYKFGRPVEVQPVDFEQIRDKYQGSPEGQKWLLTKYMGEDADGSNLHYSSPLISAKKFDKFVKKNGVALIGFFRREADSEHKVFSEAVWKLHQEIDRDDIGAATAVVMQKGIATKQNAKVPSIGVYIDGQDLFKGSEATDFLPFSEDRWTAQAVSDFLRQFLPASAAALGANGAKKTEKREL